MEIILPLFIRKTIGPVLERSGLSNQNYIGKMLNLTNLYLMKTIFLAIGAGSVLMFAGQMAGMVDVGNMSVKSADVGVFVGGALLGIGWALSGCRPGTGLVTAASGRRDALAYAVGGPLGAAAYLATYPAVKSTGMLDAIAVARLRRAFCPVRNTKA